MAEDVTVHVTIPRREWVADSVIYLDDVEVADRRFGRAVREEVAAALSKLERRLSGRANLRTIEITLVETARAEVTDDPEAHTP